jgi:hypothetical protein
MKRAILLKVKYHSLRQKKRSIILLVTSYKQITCCQDFWHGKNHFGSMMNRKSCGNGNLAAMSVAGILLNNVVWNSYICGTQGS